jgi:hypothetical protein
MLLLYFTTATTFRTPSEIAKYNTVIASTNTERVGVSYIVVDHCLLATSTADTTSYR